MKNLTVVKVLSAMFTCLLIGSILSGCSGGTESAGSTSSDSASADPTPSQTEETVEPTPTPTETKPAVSDVEFKAALAKMKVIKDDVKGYKWYEDKSSYNYYWRNEFYIYTSGGSNPTLFFNIRYYDEDWLFIKSYFFNVDGETFSFTPSYGEIQTDSDSTVTEWYNEVATQENIELVQKIANSKKTVMRLEGTKYYKDVTITKAQKTAIKNVLIVYQGLGGEL
jgi:hypothetical protein